MVFNVLFVTLANGSVRHKETLVFAWEAQTERNGSKALSRVPHVFLDLCGKYCRNHAFGLEDWDLGRVALSCHMALDLCQEMRDASWLSSKSRGSPLSLCSQCQSSSLVDLSHVDLSQQQSHSLTVDGL